MVIKKKKEKNMETDKSYAERSTAERKEEERKKAKWAIEAAMCSSTAVKSS